MATLTIRNLDDRVVRRLKERATANDRSMEAEVRLILTATVASDTLAQDWLDATVDLRGDELPIPARSMPREIPLSIEDGMIGAICSTRGATLATRNSKDFVGLGVELVNPWTARE